MFRLLKYLKKYRAESIMSPLFKLIEVAFELAVPLVMAKIIDIGISGGNKTYIVKMCGVLGLFAVGGLACTVCAQFFAARAAVGFASTLRKKLFTHIGNLSYSQLDNIGAPTLITRLTADINQVQSGMNLSLRLLLRSPFVVFGAVIMAFSVDAKSALVFAVAVPVLAVVVLSIMIACIPLYRKVQQKIDTVLAKTRGNLRGTRVIRAFGKENDEITDFNSKNEDLSKMQIAVGRISSFLNPATFILINISVAVLIYTGALRVKSGAISQGEVVALYNYMSQILVELIKLAGLIISITKAIACGNRIEAVLETVPDMKSGNIKTSENTDIAAEFEDVSLAYSEGSENALHNINLKIKKGETLGIIGATGSGKSTLVNLIPRFYEATAGKVIIDGFDVKNYDLRVLREKIGVVPQKTALFEGTIRDNLKLGKPDAEDFEIDSALVTAQAKQVVDGKPGGLDFMLEQDGRNLSGGQKQRLAIARALVKKPEILILDDSSSALDYATSAALTKALTKTNFKATVITVSQRVSAVRNADRIAVLDEGRIVGIGTHKELYESCEIYREICLSQQKTEGAL